MTYSATSLDQHFVDVRPEQLPHYEECKCPICDISENIVYARVDKQAVVRCTQCGLLYVTPRVRDVDRVGYYETEYIADEDKIQNRFGSHREAALIYIAKVIVDSKSSGKILDIGCAGGTFLKHLSDQQWQRSGVELSKTAANYARNKYNIDVYQGELFEANYADSAFDVVSVLDTLMIVPNPVGVLIEVRRILQEDGLLVVELPGYTFRRIKTMGIVPRLLKGQSVATNLSEFLYFFSDQTTTQLLKKSGFELKKIVLVPPLFYGGVVRRMLYKLYFLLVRLIYTLTSGRINLSTKVLYLASKSASA